MYSIHTARKNGTVHKICYPLLGDFFQPKYVTFNHCTYRSALLWKVESIIKTRHTLKNRNSLVFYFFSLTPLHFLVDLDKYILAHLNTWLCLQFIRRNWQNSKLFLRKSLQVATFRSMWLDWGVLNKGIVGREGGVIYKTDFQIWSKKRILKMGFMV